LLPSRLSEDQLRQVIRAASNKEEGTSFLYGDQLFAKLGKHGVAIQDLLWVCKTWEVLRTVKWDGHAWRYRIEGMNVDGKWMAVVVAVYRTPPTVVAVTGFRFPRGKRKSS